MSENYGGRFVPETLIPALDELDSLWQEVSADPLYWQELDNLLDNFAGRPTPLQEAKSFPGDTVLKREDLLHTGAHKINNALGQVLLAKRLGKKEIIAETGAGQHGVAVAAATALLGLQLRVWMGAEDIKRQAANVSRMELFGAKVLPVSSGRGTLSEAVSEAIRDWSASFETSHYIIGSVVGPEPYPQIVRDLQSVIGREARHQFLERYKVLPKRVVACTGGGSNAIGGFYAFLNDAVELIAVEAGGNELGSGASLSSGTPGILHGAKSRILQTSEGQILPAHSVSAGLDYPGVGPELAQLFDKGRIQAETATDREALDAFRYLSRKEGIIPALETAHALAWILREAPKGKTLLILSGRGDKDLAIYQEETAPDKNTKS